ncbi:MULTISPECIES: hypothetical protein [unclassified Streptomyces]|uniref:hypothetical protein n=1 Tax=unclassified Streptomyces TaxID=2593676 RepID=UPI000DDB4E7D|nr:MULTISPECIES: hypothetical protein [unclassified Streptomyces]QZZ26582.1 hypothetical protein A7X85_10210 [Streptomyces sp. ST1015]
MSAPLAVNTADGTVWTHRGSLRDGRALYAPADVCACPQYVMATEAELAEHGIAGVAYALPMPVVEAPLSLQAARVRLDQYGQRTSTWSTALYNDGTERALHKIALTLLAEVDRLEQERHSTNESLSIAAESLRVSRDRIAELESPERTSCPPALPWAELMDDDDLTGFLDELADAAIVNADPLTVLAQVEAACIRWRTIAEAQHGHNTAPGPDGITQAIAPTQALQAEDGAETGGAE